jgi:hypothetical protein
LFDFRQIEENFRQMDRKIRGQIAASELSKGKLLDEIFGQQDVVHGSDQGRSFRSFWRCLMTPASQKELDQLLEQTLNLADIKAFESEEEFRFIRFRWLEACKKVNATCALIVERLRKYLDEQAWLEDRRIMNIICKIEKTAVMVRQKAPDQKNFTTLSSLKLKVELPLERNLFDPPRRLKIDDQPQEGKMEFDTTALFQKNHVDEQLLRGRIRKALRGRSQISLEQLCEIYPVEKGLSEVLAYLNLACKDDRALVDTDSYQVIYWNSADSKVRKVHLPNVVFID